MSRFDLDGSPRPFTLLPFPHFVQIDGRSSLDLNKAEKTTFLESQSLDDCSFLR